MLLPTGIREQPAVRRTEAVCNREAPQRYTPINVPAHTHQQVSGKKIKLMLLDTFWGRQDLCVS